MHKNMIRRSYSMISFVHIFTGSQNCHCSLRINIQMLLLQSTLYSLYIIVTQNLHCYLELMLINRPTHCKTCLLLRSNWRIMVHYFKQVVYSFKHILFYVSIMILPVLLKYLQTMRILEVFEWVLPVWLRPEMSWCVLSLHVNLLFWKAATS